MLQHIEDVVLGSSDDLSLEHRCYNGACLAAGLGCLLAVIFNAIGAMPLPITLATAMIGLVYLWLYFKSRRSEVYQPMLWLYIISGVVLLVVTWLNNGGINGSGTFVSMVALVAMTVVLKRHRLIATVAIFFPVMSVLFVVEYLLPDSVIGYSSAGQRFLDVYFSFAISTAVIFIIIALILQSYDREKNKLDESKRLLEEKMQLLGRTNQDLEEALGKIQTLNGLLPICASCKKIRDDAGYWNRIESYVERHSKAVFSHSLCPDCAEKRYPHLINNATDED